MTTPLIRQHPPAFQSNNSSNENNRSLFYKTRFCDRFKAGCCPLRSEDCSYAHEASDLHDPPDNWHDKANWRPQKFCNWYNSGKDCPYGSKCAFLHLGQEKQLLNGHSRFQEPSNIISIETNKFSSEINGEQRPLPTKKKICFNWTRTGSCTFGNNCLYAHGHTGFSHAHSFFSSRYILTYTYAYALLFFSFLHFTLSLITSIKFYFLEYHYFSEFTAVGFLIF